MQNLGRNVKVTEALAYASGTADREGAIIDMQGYNGCLILVALAAVATGAVTSFKVQQGNVAEGTDFADLAGTSVAIADDEDNQVKWIDVHPTERYIRVVVDKDATNACAETAVYIQYDSYGVPLPITDADGETHFEPAEGTA